MATDWSVPAAWPGATAFILGGGPSLAGQGTDRLAGQRVIAVNSSYIAHAFADYLFSADARWLRLHQKALEGPWRGRVVTVSAAADWDGLLHLRKVHPPVKGKPGGTAVSTDRRAVAVRRSSLHGAINLAVLLGATRLVLLGADGGPHGKRRSHHAPHPWAQKKGCWDEQYWDLSTTAAPLAALGVEVVNASPGSRWDLWPIVTLNSVLAREAGRAANPGPSAQLETKV